MKKIITIICVVLSTIFYGQNVTVSIANLKVNGVSVNSGTAIDIGTNTSVNVSFRVDLDKLANYSIGNCKVWISVINSSGGRTDHYINDVPETAFTTSASKNYDFPILASEIDFGNGNYLSATLKQNNQPGAEWESEHRTIIKTPVFLLSPATLSLPCSDTSSRTFTVINSSNVNGALSYSWNVGTGWKRNGVDVNGTFTTTTNTITLEPALVSVLPSNVTMTATLNGGILPT